MTLGFDRDERLSVSEPANEVGVHDKAFELQREALERAQVRGAKQRGVGIREQIEECRPQQTILLEKAAGCTKDINFLHRERGD